MTDGERDLIERVLRFANMKRISSTGSVEDLFSRATIADAAAFRRIEPENVAAYESDQQEVREWLAPIASDNEQGIKAVALALDGRLAATINLRMLIDRGHLRVGYALTGVQACNALGVAMILDEGRGLRRRLGQCGAPGCGRFNLTFEGRPQRHCSDEHRLAADRLAAPERVRRARARAKQEAERGS